MIDNELLSTDNGVDKIIKTDATTVAKEYYTSYARYVLEYRALPSVCDGLKPVQRRIIYTANQFPQKLMKTAKLSGAVLAYHPHGSSSVTGAINEMAHPLNALPLFTTKGNFGGVNCPASADRYTECYLSEVARKNFCQFIDYADYEIGEIGEMEPVALPTLIPYCLFKGSEGIGVGLSTKVMPLNLMDLCDYYIDYIKKDGNTNKFVKPDVGYVLLEMENQDIKDSVTNYRGRITVSSIVTQISSNSFLLEGLYGKSIDAVIKKIDRYYHWFAKEQVGFRDASTSSIKYIFEVYDDSITPQEMKEALVWATGASGTYTRVLEEDGNAVYSSFEYVIKKSLECLNKAIDKKISTELERSIKQLELYSVLDKCKALGVFDNITQMTSEELVDLILRSTSCSEEVARDVVKKPISYLTKSHSSEQDDLQAKIESLKNHDRKKYLLDLYRDFKKSVRYVYEERKHTITRDMLISNPCIKFNSSDDIEVTDGDGTEFDNTIYFVSDKGVIYPRTLSTSAASAIVVDTWGDTLVGFATDKGTNYLEITTEFTTDYQDGKHWVGKSIISIDNIKKDKRFIDLREDDGEHVVEVKSLYRVPKGYSGAVKGSRIAKTTYYSI